MFSVRIVTTDHYQASPVTDLDVQHSDFRGSDVYKVPVIRVYGATPAGQKTCMHVHGVFPYLYVPYDGTQPWDRYMRQFASSLDKAVNVAQGHPTSNIQHVYKISLVSGIPMYGYHDKEQQFLKIYLYNPGIVRKVADLLLGGAVMNQSYQPHESHIPYTLQMFIDYNLYGMNMINVAAVKFRRSRREDDNGNTMETRSPESDEHSSGTPRSLSASRDDNQRMAVWDNTNISCDMCVDIERQSTCELEVDVVAADILNRLEVDANVGTNPGLAALWEDEKQRRRDRGELSQLSRTESEEHENVEITESDRESRQRYREIVLELQPYMDSQSDVTSEASQGDDVSQTEISPSPASEVDLHMSQTEDNQPSSQDTVDLDEEEEAEGLAPVISLESIKRVVSFSQSFSEATGEGLSASQTQKSSRELAEILASLAEENSPECSQIAASQIEALEEEDSVLHNTSQQVDNDPEGMSEDAETLEMSQRLWTEEEEGEEKEPVPGPSGVGEGNFNWAGMDDTWNDSQIKQADDDDDEDEEMIPQFDGAADEKPAKSKAKKSMENSEPVMSNFSQMGQQQGHDHQPYEQGQGQYPPNQQLMYEENPQFMYGSQGSTSSMQFNQGYQQGYNYGMDNSYRNQGGNNYNGGWNQGYQQDMPPSQNNMSWGQGNQGWGEDNASVQHVPSGEGSRDMVLSPLEAVNSPPMLTSPHSSLQSPTLQSPNTSIHPSPQSLTPMQTLQPLQSPTASSTSSQLDTSGNKGSQITPMQPAQMCMGDYNSANNQSYNSYNQNYYGNQSCGDYNSGTYMNQYNQMTDQQGRGQMPTQNYGGYQYNQYHGNQQQMQQQPNQWPQQFHGNQVPPQGKGKKKATQNASGKTPAKRVRKPKKSQSLPGTTTPVSSGPVKSGSNNPVNVSGTKICAQPLKEEVKNKPTSTLERLLLGDEDEDCHSEPVQRSVSRCSNISTASSRTSVGPTTPVLPTLNVGPLSSPLSPYDGKGQPQKVADLLTQVKPSSQDLSRRSSFGDNMLDSCQLSNSSLHGSQEDLFMDTSSKSQSSVLSSPVQDTSMNNSFSRPSSQTSQSPKLDLQSNFQASSGNQMQEKKSDSFSSLQSLQSLVSSVNKDPNYGVNVHQDRQLENYQSPGQGQPLQGHLQQCKSPHGHHPQGHASQGHQHQSNSFQGHPTLGQNMHQGQSIHQGHQQGNQGQGYAGHSDSRGYQQFSPPYKPAQSNMNTYHQQSHNSGNLQFPPYWNPQDRSPVAQGMNNAPYTPTHGSMKFPPRQPTSAMGTGTPGGKMSPKLQRSLSVIKKRGRPRKYDTPPNTHFPQCPLTPQSPTTPTQPRSRSNSIADKVSIVKPAASNASYTFSFQVPTPVFKRLKFHKKRPVDSPNTVKFVRMHPMDARRYSLLKIGREIVKTQNLSATDIETAVKRIRLENTSSSQKQDTCPGDTSYIHQPRNTLAQDLFGVVSDRPGPNQSYNQPNEAVPIETSRLHRECDRVESHTGESSTGAAGPLKPTLKAKLSENISNLHLKKLLQEQIVMKDMNKSGSNSAMQNVSENHIGHPHHSTERENKERMSTQDQGYNLSQEHVAQNQRNCDDKREELKHGNGMRNGNENPPAQGLKGGSQTQQNSFLSQFQNFLSKGYSSFDPDRGESPAQREERIPKENKQGEQQDRTQGSHHTAPNYNSSTNPQKNGHLSNHGEPGTGLNPTDNMSGYNNPKGHRSEGQRGYMNEDQMSLNERPEGSTLTNHMPENRMPGNHMTDVQMPERSMMSGHMNQGHMHGNHGAMLNQMPRGHISEGQMPGYGMRGQFPGPIPRGHGPGTPSGYMPKNQNPGANVPGNGFQGHGFEGHMQGHNNIEGNGGSQDQGREAGTNMMKSNNSSPHGSVNLTEIKRNEKQNTGNFLGLSDQGGCPSGHKTQLPEKKEFHSASHSSFSPRTGVRDYSHTRNIFEKLLNSKILDEDKDIAQPQQHQHGMNGNDHVANMTHLKVHPQQNSYGNSLPYKAAGYESKQNLNFSNMIDQVLMKSTLKEKLGNKLDKKMFQRDGFDGGCLVSASVPSVGVLTNEGRQDNDKGINVIRQKNLSTKKRFKVTSNGHIHNVPPVIDPDGGDVQNVILKDVNLTEASNGVLTPITSQTPVAGRSPIRHNCNGYALENYKLFDSDIICSRNELEAKLRTLKNELELQSNPLVKNHCLSEKDFAFQGRMDSPITSSWSELSSRTTSRKDSSDSYMSTPDKSKTKLKSHKRKLSLSKSGKIGHKQSDKGMKGKRSSDNSGSDMDYALEKENKGLKKTKRKKKKKEVAGIDYIVIGRFKGFRRMSVCLQRLEMDEDESVNVKEYKETHPKCKIHALNRRTSNSSSEGESEDQTSGRSSTSEDSTGQSSPEKKANVREETCDDWSNDSKEQQADIDSDDPKSASKGNKRKKKLTRNQKLQIAFLSKKSRRKKVPGSGKLMNCLSLLHEATIANLNDTRLSYNENTDDCKIKYEDAMFKMSFISSSDSEKGNVSPPIPLSPEELAQDHQGLTRSTSEAQSPVLPISDNSQSPVYSTLQTTMRINSSGSEVCPVYQPIMNQVNMCDSDFKPFSSVSLRSPSSQTPAYGLGEGRASRYQEDYSSSDSKDLEDSLNSDSSKSYRKKAKLKEAVIRLKPLSPADIQNFSGKSNERNPSNLERVCSPVDEKQMSGSSSDGSNSPPDLGPPNIPKYPKTGGTTDDSQSPPPLMSSPNTLQLVRTPQGHTGFGMYEHKSPVSSNGSLNVVHSDRFSDISDDEDDLHLQLDVDDEEPDIHLLNRCEEKRNSSSPWMLHFPKENHVPSMSGSGSDEEMPSLTKERISTESDESMCVDSLVRKCVGQNNNALTQPATFPLNNSSSSQRLPTSFQNFENRDMEANSNQLHPSKDFGADLGDRVCRKVLTPDILPPSRNMVQNTATSYGLNSAVIVPAYCSNPDDLPEQPRELGGRILGVQSTRVKDYDEFCNYTDCEGLLALRSRMMSQDQIVLSQSENKTLMNRIEKEPQLRFALLGDRSIVISPCNPPPTQKTVKKWEIGRKVWKEMKNKEKQLKKETNKKSDEKGNSQKDDSETRNSGHEFSSNETLTNESATMGLSEISVTNDRHEDSSTKYIHENDTTKNSRYEDVPRTLFVEGESESSDDDSEIIGPSPPSGLRFSQFSRSRLLSSQSENSPARSNSEPVTPNTESGIVRDKLCTLVTPQTGSGIVRDKICTPKTPQTVSSIMRDELGNTPVTPVSEIVDSPILPDIVSDDAKTTPSRRISALFSSAFTPVLSGRKPSATSTPSEDRRVPPSSISDKTPGKFATPRRLPLPRRLSSNTQKSLQQALQFTQLQQFATPRDQKGHTSQIDGPTPQNSFGFKVSQDNLQEAKALHVVQNLTVLSLELHAETRGDLRPDPEVDAVKAVFYSISNDVDPAKGKTQVTGVVIVDLVSADAERALKERRQKRINSQSPPSSSTSTGSRSWSPQPSSSRSPRPSTSRPRSPLPSTSKSPQPSTSKGRSLSPKPSTPRGRRGRGKAKGAVTPPPRRYNSTEDIPSTFLQRSGIDLDDLQVNYVRDEEELYTVFLDDLFEKWDPDILVGYEIQNFSWGYLLQRASHLSIPLCSKLSRIPGAKTGSHFSASKDEYGSDHMSEIHIAGRIVLNLWRLLRHEVTLNIYSFENACYHILHQRIPQFSYRTLSNWYNHRTHLYRWRLIEYYITRVKGNLQIIDQLDLIGRTSEFARVFGIEFYHVLSRGSQYRVESMMLRLAKPLNYIPASPSVHQRARMRSPECIALTLEPDSRFYADPVVVVDFQSLYPSIMIAHNYCFATCLGRLKWLDKAHEGPIEFGCTHLKIPPSVLKKFENDITVSPNGVVFVQQHVRKGVISAMVEEILNTRLMVKKAMKAYKNDKALSKLLDARQLGLKLIANVTYGYTAANFSGRMPCIEVGDSIVRKARETLERAIKLVEDTPRWGARVVYGDTDSMFIELKGRSKDEAFKIGYEICDAVTAANPKPMKLKFEKVYLPCILQTKKRYVGFSYETPDQKEPIFDAKGIETVRRDACPAVAKILERTIKTLFTTRDVSQTKKYVQTQCRKLMEGKVSLQDLVFAKEYRGMAGYKPGACVPALELSKKKLQQDRRSEPRVGERVPYVIVYGSPGLPLIQLVRSPSDLLADPSLRLNATYYITKQILPPLNRIFSLMGVNVFSWYNDMPKVTRIVPPTVMAADSKKGTISSFFSVVSCPVCEEQTHQDICNKCAQNPQRVAVTLNKRIREWDQVYANLTKICNNCMSVQDDAQPCVSLDCPILFRRNTAKLDISKGQQLRNVASKVLDF
ncbi:uncharacterized protein [Argopecten irradians]|uniref:uncharacterized protein n=1 Tax=Argopecten irradians TaxID=31199 RepID=UPI00372300BF